MSIFVVVLRSYSVVPLLLGFTVIRFCMVFIRVFQCYNGLNHVCFLYHVNSYTTYIVLVYFSP